MSYFLVCISTQEIGFFDDSKNTTGALATRLSTDASAMRGVSNVFYILFQLGPVMYNMHDYLQQQTRLVKC
jgi:hypothetical protein